MKAFKCDLCGKFCEDVYTINGISKPETHKFYEFMENGHSADCCPSCYEEVMRKVEDIIIRNMK